MERTDTNLSPNHDMSLQRCFGVFIFVFVYSIRRKISQADLSLHVYAILSLFLSNNLKLKLF